MTSVDKLALAALVFMGLILLFWSLWLDIALLYRRCWIDDREGE